MLTKANAIGYAVLALIYDRLNDSEVRAINVEPYLNGRESGFAIHFWAGAMKNRYDRKFVFSEMRGSDSIVVYEAKTHEFSMQGNGLNNKIYSDCTCFSPDKIWDAVDHIVNRMREEMESD